MRDLVRHTGNITDVPVKAAAVVAYVRAFLPDRLRYLPTSRFPKPEGSDGR